MPPDDFNIVYKMMLDAEKAKALLGLFRPVFIEKDGCILLAANLDVANFDDVVKKNGGNVRSTELVFNTIDFTDILNWDRSSEEFHSFVLEVAESWKSKLLVQFPSKHFSVEVVDFSGDGAWGIELCQSP